MQLLDRLKSSVGQLGSHFSRPTLTLSIEGSNLRLMAAEGGGVSGWLNVPLHPRLVSDGRIEDPARLSKVIISAIERLGMGSVEVVAAFPSSRISFHMMSLPAAKGIQPDRAVPREARRIMGSALDYHYPFWSPLGKTGLEQRYYLLAAPKSELTSFLQALALSGLKPKKVDSRALALTRAVSVSSGVILNVESSGVDVIVVSDYVPMVVARRELRMGLRTEELAEEIGEELRTSIEYYGDRNAAAPISPNSPVYVAGGHPLLETGLAQALADSLTQPLLFPEPAISYPEEFPILQFMVNVGLALKSL